jgi:hypothetical protein
MSASIGLASTENDLPPTSSATMYIAITRFTLHVMQRVHEGAYGAAGKTGFPRWRAYKTTVSPIERKRCELPHRLGARMIAS